MMKKAGDGGRAAKKLMTSTGEEGARKKVKKAKANETRSAEDAGQTTETKERMKETKERKKPRKSSADGGAHAKEKWKKKKSSGVDEVAGRAEEEGGREVGSSFDDT
eukprot:Tamp_39052.p2 GENE.Tamp_39052~~Tamp_39052.p2  ORF type:complete len:107 (-),score=36.41 Tamp_39052:171-491(-)